MTACATLVMTK